jgi:protein-disulfide isomerase
MSRLAFALLVLVGLQEVPAAAPRRVADPDVTYAVPVGTSPTLGPANAKVTMVIAFDYACPFCRQCWSTIDQLRAKYGKDLRVVYKAFIVHPDRATAATYAACAAHHQGKWRAMTDLLWTKAYDARDFDQANIDALERQAGLDLTQAERDIAGACRLEIAADAKLFKKLAVRATPTSFINGRVVEGAQDIAVFEKVIDEELAKADAAIKRGVKPEQLYDTEIVGKGVPQIP